MPFVPDAVPAGGYFEPDEEKSIAGFGKNLVGDVTDTAKSLGTLGQNLFEHPVDTTVGVVKGIPSAVVNEGKRIGVGELLTGNPGAAADKFGNAMYQKPLTTGLDVLPVAGAVGKALGFGGEAAKAAELGAQASKVAEGAPAAAEAAAAGAKAAPLAADDLVRVAGSPAGKSATMEAAEDFARNPPKPPPAAAPAANPLKEVSDYVTQKYGQAAAKPGWAQNVANYLKNEVADIRGKDIGLQPRQIQSMGEGFEGLKKAEALMDYADEKGYFKPGLTDVARKQKIISETEKAGQELGAIRDIAGKRGVAPADQIFNQAKAELTAKYGIKAPADVKKALSIIKQGIKNDPSFSGMADLATELNKMKTPARKLGQTPGVYTDAANITGHLNNDGIRALLNPEEQELYTQRLRDYGAHKKLEQAVAASGRRAMSARSNQRGILGRLYQEALDRGGYRVAGNVADRTAKSILKNPEAVKTLPQFFEELAHHADDVLDESIEGQGMAHGGVVGDVELNEFLKNKYGEKETR